MENKVLVIIEILIIIVACGYYAIVKIVPDLKDKYGSSDKFISTSEYSNMIEFNIDGANFAIVLNTNKRIYHLMFFDKKALCLYNQGIEDKSITDGIDKIVELLVFNGYLNEKSLIVITRYDEDDYDLVKDNFINSMKKNNLNNMIIEEKNTLSSKAKYLEIKESDRNDGILRNIDLYSKNIAREKSSIVTNGDSITDDSSINKGLSYTNYVYMTIEKYVADNRINDLEKGNEDLIITLIPATSDKRFYPTNNSWYYVKNKKIYAYIEIKDNNDIYKYCYKGSIDENVEGEC